MVTIANGSDFDDFAGIEYRPSDRFRITHTGSFFGKRDPRPFLTAFAESGLDDAVVRFVGDFRPADAEWAETLELGDRLELIPYVARRRSLELQRDSEALLLLIPEAGGRGRGVLSGKVFEYLAAERPILAVVPPDGAAAELIRETGAGVDRRRRRTWPAIREALRGTARPLARGRPGRHAARSGDAHASGARDARRGARRADAEPRGVRITRFLFFATIFCVTFEKVRWNVAGNVSLADILALGFLILWTLERLAKHDRRLARTSAVVACFGLAFLLAYFLGYFSIDTADGAAQFWKGFFKWAIHVLFLIAAVTYIGRRARAVLLADARRLHGRRRRQRIYGVLQLVAAQGGRNLDNAVPAADHRRRELDQHLRRRRGAERLPPERADGRPEPPRDHDPRPAADVCCRSTCGCRRRTGSGASSRSCSGFC